MRHACTLILVAGAMLWLTATARSSSGLDRFEQGSDIGNPAHAGAVRYDSATGTFTVTGGGKNMWAGRDAFYFVWKRLRGDVDLTAAVHWAGKGTEAHRKACLVIRQSLDADSPYVDAALHGDGLTALQFRDRAGGDTHEIRSNVSRPTRIGIVKRGDWFFMTVAEDGKTVRPAGGSVKLVLKAPFYVGVGVCAHNDAVVERATFSEVSLTTEIDDRLSRIARGARQPRIRSTLEVLDIASGNRRVVYETAGVIEAPNWTRAGLLFNAEGHIYTLPVNGGKPRLVDTGAANRCNNDHGPSPDGRWLAVSSQHDADHQSRIYLVPSGGAARLLTPLAPSYWHGWSPDGRTVVYCAQRNGNFDVYAMDIAGGKERRLTTAPGLDDGPEYTPDGKYIYFNSVRSGRMQIWRMRPDGSKQEQVTSDGFNNWFPHPSPDGKWIVFLSYGPEVDGHPANKEVLLRLMPFAGGKVRALATVFGGQGTINVPSWSPDSRQVAFVSYLVVNP